MRDFPLADEGASGALGQAGASEADRFSLVSRAAWGRWYWFFLAMTATWLLSSIADWAYVREAALFAALAILVYYLWFGWTGWRRREDPEKNFVQLARDEMRIVRYGWPTLKVPYAEIAGVGPAARISAVESWAWLISKRERASYLEIQLSRPFRLNLPLLWRSKRLFLRPVELTQFELALKAHVGRFQKGVG